MKEQQVHFVQLREHPTGKPILVNVARATSITDLGVCRRISFSEDHNNGDYYCRLEFLHVREDLDTLCRLTGALALEYAQQAENTRQIPAQGGRE